MKQQSPPLAFTTYANGLLRVLKNGCRVSAFWDPSAGSQEPTLTEFSAIWDTGATNCVLSQRVVDTLLLVPVNYTTVRHAQGLTENVPVFLVNMILPNNLRITGVEANLGQFDKDSDLLIGMDIIGLGDFAVTRPDDKTKFTFRYPAAANIDFYSEQAKANALRGQSTPSEQTRQRLRQQRKKGK